MPTIIRTIADLAALPEDQLGPCLRSLKARIELERKAHRKDVNQFALPKDTPFEFTQFEWDPLRESALSKGHATSRGSWIKKPSPAELVETRRGLSDDAPIRMLRLRPVASERAGAASFWTVGQLRWAPLKELVRVFGQAGVREVLQALEDTGVPHRFQATQHEKWALGILSLEECEVPTHDEAPIEELRPWIGWMADKLDEAGIVTLGRLRKAAAQGSLSSIDRIGKSAEKRLLRFLESITP